MGVLRIPDRMDADEWRRIGAVLDHLSSLDAEAARESLADVCANAGVRSELVTPFLIAERDTSGFPERLDPAVVDAAIRAFAAGGAEEPLAPGHRFGPYEIVASIGAGGMGEVYKARDTRLDRLVALKRLRADLAARPDGRARFEREARAISALNHPHICALYDVGVHDGVEFLVMELVEGETLAARLKKGPLPAHEALEYAAQITDALDAAHRKGVVHRDLKPANIMLTPQGVKLLDFGLVRLRDREPLDSATAAPLTSEGTILGTLHYMAPEQLQGKDADRRADLFSFGAILYEMLTGTQAFAADDPASVIAAVLERDPAAVAGNVPGLDPALGWTLARCLAKSPSARWQDAADLASQLRWLKQSSDQRRVVFPGVGNRRVRPYVFAAAVVSAAVVGAAAYWAWRPPQAPSMPSYRFEIPPPDGTSFAGPFAVSPDGRRLAFTTTDDQGRRTLWVRSLEALGADVIENTAGAAYPFWSPDSQSIAFFADRKLKVVELATATVRILSDAGAGGGGTWNKDGVILFGPESGVRSTTGLLRVAADGGDATPVTHFTDDFAGAHAWPQFLPDGRHYLYSRVEIRLEDGTSTPTGGVFVGVLGSNEARPILTSTTVNADAQSSDEVPTHRAMYAGGHLFYVRGRRLLAQPFDAAGLTLVGDPVRIEDNVEQTAPGRSAFHVSETGLLVYRHAAASGTSASTQLTWFDRSGREIGPLGDPAPYRAVAISPQGQYVVGAGAARIVRIDVTNGTPTPLPITGNVVSPVWSPDATKLAFTGGTGGPTVVRISAADGSGQPEIVFNPREQVYANDWSADGSIIVGTAIHAGTGYDVFALAIGSRAATYPIASAFHETDPDLSPDSRWLAYAVNGESRQWEVFVQPFGRSGGVWRVSRSGGRHPRWSANGRELFYVTPEGALLAASVETGPTFRVVETRELFRHPSLRQDFGVPLSYSPYDVVSDARRFLLRVPADPLAPRPIVTIMNWPALLEP